MSMVKIWHCQSRIYYYLLFVAVKQVKIVEIKRDFYEEHHFKTKTFKTQTFLLFSKWKR